MADANRSNRPNDDADPFNESTDARLERAKDVSLGAHGLPHTHADELGEAVGGVGGVLVGAGIGAAAGPVGILLGGIIGALTGWWTGRAVAEAAAAISAEDDAHYRAHFESSIDRPDDRAYEDVRGAYYLGQIASHNPNYNRGEFADVEVELERGWEPNTAKYGAWEGVRDYAEEGYERGYSRLDEEARRKQAARRADSEQRGRTANERPEERP